MTLYLVPIYAFRHRYKPKCYEDGLTGAFRNGSAPDVSPCNGVPAPAGEPTPENGDTVPLGGTGILMSSGLAGMIDCDRPSM